MVPFTLRAGFSLGMHKIIFCCILLNNFWCNYSVTDLSQHIRWPGNGTSKFQRITSICSNQKNPVYTSKHNLYSGSFHLAILILAENIYWQFSIAAKFQYYCIIHNEGHNKFQILTGYPNSHVHANDLIFPYKISTTSPRWMKAI